MLQLALIVALLCVIPCFLGLCIIYMQVLTIKGAIVRCEQLARDAEEKTALIDGKIADLDQPNFTKVQAAIVEVDSKAEKAYLKAENTMESLMHLVNKVNTRERDAQKKARREEKIESEEQPEVIEPEALQYNLLNGGLDRMPADRRAAKQDLQVRKRKFGEAPLPQRALGA